MPRRPRKTRTYEDVTRLEGTEFYQLEDGVTFYLENIAVDSQIYLGDLVARFYNINEEQNPLFFKLLEDASQSIPEKTWHVAMRGNFFIDIEKNFYGTEGPHRTRLFFKTFSKPQVNHWIASLQLMAFYFNEEQMKAALLLAIANREFYVAPDDINKTITP